MPASNVSPEGLSARVRSLESQNRVWKLSSLALFLILAVSVAKGLMAQGTAPNHPITIEAQTFLLREVVSMGRCNTNTTLQSIRRSLKSQRFSWALIETQSDFIQLRLRVAGQVRLLRQVLPQ